MKVCRECGEEKPRSEFFRCRTGPKAGEPSQQAYCRECFNARRRAAFSRLSDGEKALHRQKAKDWYSRNRVRVAGKQKEWAAGNPEKVFANRLRKYGISVVEYDEMMLRQGGMCAICDKEGGLTVDHCHDTGRVRGLLCHGCNMLIGHAREDSAVLERSAAYVQSA